MVRAAAGSSGRKSARTADCHISSILWTMAVDPSSRNGFVKRVPPGIRTTAIAQYEENSNESAIFDTRAQAPCLCVVPRVDAQWPCRLRSYRTLRLSFLDHAGWSGL